jgi:CheY-like chemotaxis protein
MFKEAPSKYDLIFMDVQMPEMDGYDATRRIRAIEAELSRLPERHAAVPIIAMTANVFKEDIEKCLAAGMDSHVGKPLDFDEVLNRLHTYLK